MDWIQTATVVLLLLKGLHSQQEIFESDFLVRRKLFVLDFFYGQGYQLFVDRTRADLWEYSDFVLSILWSCGQERYCHQTPVYGDSRHLLGIGGAIGIFAWRRPQLWDVCKGSERRYLLWESKKKKVGRSEHYYGICLALIGSVFSAVHFAIQKEMGITNSYQLNAFFIS